MGLLFSIVSGRSDFVDIAFPLAFDHNSQNTRLAPAFSPYSYNSIKTWIQKGNTTTPLGPTLHMVAAAEAGILTLCMTNPIWVVKTRLCLQYGTECEPHNQYRGMFDALSKIYRAEGVRGLYRVSRDFFTCSFYI